MSKPEHYRIHKISFLKSLLVRWYLRKYSHKQWSQFPEHLRVYPYKAGK